MKSETSNDLNRKGRAINRPKAIIEKAQTKFTSGKSINGQSGNIR